MVAEFAILPDDVIVASFVSAIAAEDDISPFTIVPSTMSAEVIEEARFNLLYAIAAEALISAFTIVPFKIMVEVTEPVSVV